jgi:hypothetical protein
MISAFAFSDMAMSALHTNGESGWSGIEGVSVLTFALQCFSAAPKLSAENWNGSSGRAVSSDGM